MAQKHTVTEYPTGLSSIPYASFLEIQKFSYDSAQKYAAENFNDAGGSLGRSGLARKLNNAVDGLAAVYGSGDTSTEKGKINLYQTRYQVKGTSVRSKGKSFVDINTANDSTKVKVNGQTMTIGQLKKKKQEMIDKQNKGLMASKCMLPLPNEFQYKYGADWNNEFKLGTLALAADEAYRFGAIAGAGGAIGGLASYGTSKLTAGSKVPGADQATKVVQGVVSGMKNAATPFKVESELNTKNIAGLAGLAPNENSIQFFERMQGREFGFRFELASRNKNESNTVIDIIEWFKRGMHPGSKNGKGSAVLLTFPDVFVLTPKFVKCGTNGLPLGRPIPLVALFPPTPVRLCVGTQRALFDEPLMTAPSAAVASASPVFFLFSSSLSTLSVDRVTGNATFVSRVRLFCMLAKSAHRFCMSLSSVS